MKRARNFVAQRWGSLGGNNNSEHYADPQNRGNVNASLIWWANYGCA